MSKIQIDVIEFAAQRVLANFGEDLKASEIRDAANVVLKAFSVEKIGEDDELVEYQVTQNMMTNYIINGRIDGAKRKSAAQVRIANADVEAFIIKFVDARVNGTQGKRNNVDALAESLKGELAEMVESAE
jgi:predicted methyltransferase MtxX (methanogen marker protein 4)